jgi:hypothetical protein
MPAGDSIVTLVGKLEQEAGKIDRSTPYPSHNHSLEEQALCNECGAFFAYLRAVKQYQEQCEALARLLPAWLDQLLDLRDEIEYLRGLIHVTDVERKLTALLDSPLEPSVEPPRAGQGGGLRGSERDK